MAELGFWNFAQQNPQKLALVDPERPRVDARRAARRGEPHRARAARARAAARATASPSCSPNGAEMLEIYLAATQVGLYLTPINHHLDGPEIALHRCRTAAPRSSSATSASPTPARPRRDEIELPGRALLRGRRDRRLPALRRAQRRPADDAARAIAPPAR